MKLSIGAAGMRELQVSGDALLSRGTESPMAVLEVALRPVGASERVRIVPESADHLYSDRQTARPRERWNRDAWQAEQRPAAIEDRTAGIFESLRRFPWCARREQYVEFAKYAIDELAALHSHRLLDVVDFRGATHAVLDALAQRR